MLPAEWALGNVLPPRLSEDSLYIFSFRFAQMLLARSLAELEELRRVCFFATNSANFLEFFLLCVFVLRSVS